MKELEFKDVSHLYLPFELRPESGSTLTCFAVINDTFNRSHEIVVLNGNVSHRIQYGLWKPILRPLSDMTHAELCEFVGQRFAFNYCNTVIENISGSMFELHKFLSQFSEYNSIPYLLSKGFDLFGLIPRGLAIDKTTIESDKSITNKK
jgi:hypothetical protein